MKYVYIDGGARIGESIEIILENREELNGCDVYLFECNPNHIETLNKIKNENINYNFMIKNDALWIEDCEKKFFISIDKWGDLGCTLHENKREKLDLTNPITVNCIDTSKFLESLGDDVYIIMKLDIEGAEYDVLNHMINNGTINKVNELYVEFHDSFFNIDSTPLKEKIQNFNIKCDFNWM